MKTTLDIVAWVIVIIAIMMLISSFISAMINFVVFRYIVLLVITLFLFYWAFSRVI
jgi:hypothetical protein